MARAVILCIFVGIVLHFSRGQSQEENLKKELQDFKKEVLSELSAQQRYIHVVDESLNALRRSNQNGISPATNIQPGKTIENFLDNTAKKMRNLSAKVQVLENQVYSLKEVYNNLEALNSSLQMTLNEVKASGDEVNILQKISNNSLEMMTGLSSAVSHDSKISAEGIIVAQEDAVVSISLPSLHQSKMSTDLAYQVAFDPNSRMIYWLNEDYDIKRANLDGTDVEYIARGKVSLFALDSITGNFYHQNVSSSDIVVCSKDGEKCSVVVPNQYKLNGMVVYPSKSLMFWFNRTSLVRANMDGTNATVILSKRLRDFYVDEGSDRAYWISRHDGERAVGSCNLNGQDVRVLLNTTRHLVGVAVDGNDLYLTDLSDNTVHSVSKDGGNPTVIARTTGRIADIAFYGSKAQTLENPCENSPCSYLCVLKLESYACLCPEGDKLYKDGATCV